MTRTCCRCRDTFETSGRANRCRACRAVTEAAAQAAKLGQPLTPRERMVAADVAAGHPNKEIAWRQRLTEGTVKVYTSRIFEKLGVSNRVQLTLAWLAAPPDAASQEGEAA